MNEQNLTNMGKGFATREEAQRLGSKGGKKSGISRNANKYLKELAIDILIDTKPNETGERFYQRNGMSSKKSKDTLEAIIKGHAVKAMKGDPASTKILLELLGVKFDKEMMEETEKQSGGVVEIPSVLDE